MSTDLRTQLVEYGRYHRETQPPLNRNEIVSTLEGARPPQDEPVLELPVEVLFASDQSRWRGAGLVAAVAAAILLLVGGAAWLSRQQGVRDPAQESTVTTLPAQPLPDPGETLPSGGTPLPDFAAAVQGDDGVGPLPLGTVNRLPDSVRLDFLFEFCGWYGPECFRDAHFIDPDNPGFGSGNFTAGRPFHVRHGFVNNGEEPLGEGFDVALYVTASGFDFDAWTASNTGVTQRYQSDYVVRGETDRCGPSYKTQEGTEICEWFVHEFPDGLPEGRFAMWAVWQAPCRYWADLGFTAACSDPDAIMSMFSSGYDGPFDANPPFFEEQNQVAMNPDDFADVFENGGGFPPIDSGFGAVIAPPVDASGAAATSDAPPLDLEGAVPGDDGAGPLPLGTVNELPNEDRLDFLFEFCSWGPECFRDAHFMDPTDPTKGSGPWTSGRPFHVRHGFINNGDEPLGEGFDVALYVIREDGAADGFELGRAYRYQSDYVLRGETDQCGPTYKTQSGVETCEWFVHDFPDGLPDGRFTLWAVWEAPCSAWVELGFADSCADPDEVTSMFSSGVNSPFGSFPPSFTELNEAQLRAEEVDELRGGFGPGPVPQPPPDASGASATGGSPLPDVEGAVIGDDGSGPLALGTVDGLPNEDRLDFLFEFCGWYTPDCFRDAHFMDPTNPSAGSGPWTSGRPFHIRHGFVNSGAEPLGDGFDVVVYVIRMDGAGAGYEQGTTYRFQSDYVLRGEIDRCGPTYRSQTGPVTCEWFVHDFPDGLPEGRFALWAVWEAPCSAWLDYGFTDSCTDPDEVTSMFSSGVDSPFGPFPPDFTERSDL